MRIQSGTPGGGDKKTKPPSVTATSVVETLGEPARPVFIRPYTIQGCRPISVNSQPNVLAAKGAAMQAPTPHRFQRPSSNGLPPRRARHSAHADMIRIRKPRPTISRKLQ